jgi:two-component system sensor histidine kinase HydH
MQFTFHHRDNWPLLAGILALFILGAGSVGLTWRSIRHQEDGVREHLLLTGSMALRGVETDLVRSLRRFQRPGAESILLTLASDLFRARAGEDGLLFLGLFGLEGQALATSDPPNPSDAAGTPPDASLSPEALESLSRTGQFQSMAVFRGSRSFVVGLRVRAGMLRAGWEAWRGHGHGLHGLPPSEDVPVYLVLVLDAEGLLARSAEFRRAAMLQTGYVLGAGLALWGLAVAYARRRGQAGRVRALENFQSRLLDNMPDGLVTLGPDGAVRTANHSALALLDPEGGGILGRRFEDLGLAPAGEEPEGAASDGDLSWRQYRCRGRHLEVLSLPVRDARGQEAERLALIRDRTRVRELERSLNEAERLAAIGSLAAGVAHEIRNPLSSLRGFAQFFADKLAGQEPHETFARTMVQEADRLNRVVGDLLYLSKPKEAHPSEVDAAETFGSLARLLRFDLEHQGARLDTEAAAPLLWADPDGLRQVLLNVLVNALDAVPAEGGVVRMSTRPDEGGVWVEVADNGGGMTEEVRRRALEPFFTAKAKGTGLGLAIAQAVMRAHGGRILLECPEEGGTVVKLFFPDGVQETPEKTKKEE